MSTRLRTSEAELQQSVIAGLRYLGFTVLSTSRVRRKCPACGQVSHGGDGADRGVPDLLVTRSDWPQGRWTAIEIKGPRTRVSPEQQALADQGRIHICRSWEDVEAAVKGCGDDTG